jgi:predicted trehalose synthase
MSAPASTPLAEWIARQRWYGGKGGTPRLREIGSFSLGGKEPVRAVTHLLLDEIPGRGALYQVPITERSAPLEGADDALITVANDEQGELVYLYDAPHDPVYAARLLRLIVAGGHEDGVQASARGVPVTDVDLDGARSRVLRGEQSNTSIVVELAGGAGNAVPALICKVFRTLHHGENPDVVLQSALYEAGSHSVPLTIGSVLGQWADSGRQSGRASGHLAFAQEFLAGARDAWPIALAAAENGEDFTESARQIGIATADAHATLASVLPAREADAADIEGATAGWRRRLADAIDAVPQLGELREVIDGLYRRAAAAPWPPLQRVHGDLHLGQILATPDGRWALIDFEGEPLRPLSERNEPDCPVRDVAGMLRSFDYVAGTKPDAPHVREWARDCRQAFLDGYVERAGADVRRHQELLDAFEADKALYEAVYEARNRPTWLPIPVDALTRIAERAGKE